MPDDTTSSSPGGSPPSGRFVLRLDPLLHARLRERAREAGVSLNEYCATTLALPPAPGGDPGSAVVARAEEAVGEALLAVAAFGSWARGQEGQGSDVDILIAVDRSLPLGRDLYRRWDERPLTWEGHPVEPHFVHLPPSESRLSGMWAEVAVDGVVLFERGLVVSRRLGEFRRLIAAGRVQRRRSHGHTYWVEVA